MSGSSRYGEAWPKRCRRQAGDPAGGATNQAQATNSALVETADFPAKNMELTATAARRGLSRGLVQPVLGVKPDNVEHGANEETDNSPVCIRSKRKLPRLVY